MRDKLTGVAAVGLAVGLVLTACSPVDDDGDPGAAPSFEDCGESPLDCNSGERAEGGEIIWLVNQGWDSNWNRNTAVGNSAYARQALIGVLADIGSWQPDGQWGWNMDLLAAEPELVSEDPMQITYQLREEAVWSDGTPITVDDFEFQWRALSGREDHCVGCSPPDTTGFASLESIEGSGDGKTVTITYQAGVGDPDWFGRYGAELYPAHVIEEAGIDWRTPAGMGEATEYFVENVPDWSGGPYLIDSAVVDQRVELVPNPNWYGATRPSLDRIVKEVISDQGAWLQALRNEEIHGGAPASWTIDFRQQVDQEPGIISVAEAGWNWEHVDFNMDSVTDLALRRAIFTAINTEHARDAIWGDIAPELRTNHIFPASSEYYQDHLEGTGYGTGDAEAARAILEDAGYAGAEPGGTLTDPDGEPVPTLRFAYLSGNENRATFTELAIAYLDEIGVTVEPDPTPGEQLGTVLDEQDFDLVIYGWNADPFFTGSAHQQWHSTSGSNYGKLDNPQVDALSEEIREQVDVADAAVLVNQVVPLVMDEAYVLPLWSTPELVFVADSYTHVRPNFHAQANPLYNIGEWGMAAAAVG